MPKKRPARDLTESDFTTQPAKSGVIDLGEVDGVVIKPKAPKRPRDLNQLAVHIGRIATHEIEDVTPQVNPASKRGEARAAKLSPERRKEIAKKAAETRWKKEV